ncbi:MAG: ABC transporter ATP-binding protein [Anaerolineales bacterium]|nr:ABC transporter ATP-binding protein [Anaerolineales bacterium]
MEWLIEISHLNRWFGAIKAVQDVNFQVAEGEIFGLVGPDGAGKTTTLRLLCGAYHPTQVSDQTTTIRVGGYDVLKETELARSQLGYLSQRFSLYEDLTVLENIRFFAEIRGLSSRDWQPRCLEILDFVGLIDFKDRRAGQLSGGMKQKLGLASALVSRPRILLLDEPTTGVDPVTRQDFWQLIIHLVATPQNGQGVCVLISTPYMDEASRCHRLAFMRGGKIISKGTADQMRATLKERIVELRGTPLPLLKRIALQNPDIEDVTAFGDRLHLRMKKSLEQKIIDSLQVSIQQAGGFFDQARAIPPSLEDVFIDLANKDD